MTLDDESKLSLKPLLLQLLVQSRKGPGFVLRKICVAVGNRMTKNVKIATYAVKSVPTLWPQFLMDVEQTLQRAFENDVNAALEVFLEFLTVVPEEFGRAELSAEKKFVRAVRIDL